MRNCYEQMKNRRILRFESLTCQTPSELGFIRLVSSMNVLFGAGGEQCIFPRLILRKM